DWRSGGSLPESIVMAYGYNFPDGLCAGLLGYEMGAPLILTANGDETQAALYAGTLGVTQGVVLGGPSLINDEAVRTILSLHEDDEVVSFSNMSAMVMALGRR
ncbi:MAG: cell wall-binding repeat-containing protein, partial [Oscillospiraceae bacterium]|nr:cell wall-binding repeat-containing protein [Oscillospiraceae bacterium]